MQTAANQKTLDPLELINKLAISFEEYKEKSGAKIFESFGDRPPQYHSYFALRGYAGRGQGGRGKGHGRS